MCTALVGCRRLVPGWWMVGLTCHDCVWRLSAHGPGRCFFTLHVSSKSLLVFALPRRVRRRMAQKDHVHAFRSAQCASMAQCAHFLGCKSKVSRSFPLWRGALLPVFPVHRDRGPSQCSVQGLFCARHDLENVSAIGLTFTWSSYWKLLEEGRGWKPVLINSIYVPALLGSTPNKPG